MRSLRLLSSTKLEELAYSLRTKTDGATGQDTYPTQIPRLSLLRSDQANQPANCLFKPALYMTLQGAKLATFGSKRYKFAAGEALMVAVDIPSRGTVVVATPKTPYLGIQLGLDVSVMQEMAEEVRITPRAVPSKPPARGALVVELNFQLLDCALRAVNMLDTPDAIPILYPGIMREVCYWLLKGSDGPQVAEIMIMANGQDQRVIQSINLVRDKLNDAIRVADLAQASNMSQTTFHRQFKAVTGMTPIQYQKQLRLHEGRRRLIFDNVTVETAAREVGYASVSQFSREYTRMFASAPRRDVSLWRRGRPTG